MRVCWAVALLLLVAASFPKAADAAKGEVVLRKSGCDYFIVETDMGYALLEAYRGADPSEGNTLVGDYESYGMKDIYNLSADFEMRVWVEDYWLSKEDAIERLYNECN